MAEIDIEVTTETPTVNVELEIPEDIIDVTVQQNVVYVVDNDLMETTYSQSIYIQNIS
jgi:hypothetical protein